MENIGKFLDAMDAYGLNSFEKFQTVDLYEATNMTQVVLSIHALGRLVSANIATKWHNVLFVTLNTRQNLLTRFEHRTICTIQNIGCEVYIIENSKYNVLHSM